MGAVRSSALLAVWWCAPRDLDPPAPPHHPHHHRRHCCCQVEKEKDSLRAELIKAKQALKEGEEAAASQRSEIDRLGAIIAEADTERLRQRKE